MDPISRGTSETSAWPAGEAKTSEIKPACHGSVGATIEIQAYFHPNLQLSVNKFRYNFYKLDNIT